MYVSTPEDTEKREVDDRAVGTILFSPIRPEFRGPVSVSRCRSAWTRHARPCRPQRIRFACRLRVSSPPLAQRTGSASTRSPFCHICTGTGLAPPHLHRGSALRASDSKTHPTWSIRFIRLTWTRRCTYVRYGQVASLGCARSRKESVTFTDQLEQLYAYFSTAGEDTRIFGFGETTTSRFRDSDLKRVLSRNGIPEGTRVSHPTRGLGVLGRIDANQSRSKHYIVEYDDGEVHRYSAESIKKLKRMERPVSRRVPRDQELETTFSVAEVSGESATETMSTLGTAPMQQPGTELFAIAAPEVSGKAADSDERTRSPHWSCSLPPGLKAGLRASEDQTSLVWF